MGKWTVPYVNRALPFKQTEASTYMGLRSMPRTHHHTPVWAPYTLQARKLSLKAVETDTYLYSPAYPYIPIPY